MSLPVASPCVRLLACFTLLCADYRSAAAQALRSVGSSFDVDPVVRVRDSLAAALQQSLPAHVAEHAPPGWSDMLRAVERRLRLAWRGPAPVLLMVDDAGSGFACPPGADATFARCRGRVEGFRSRSVRDTTVVTIVLVAASSWLDRAAWEHELTHALLMQYDLIAESERHDRRYFIARATNWP